MPVSIHIFYSGISNEEKAKLFKVNLEGRLKFNFHVNKLLNKVSKKYHALARVCNTLTQRKEVLL